MSLGLKDCPFCGCAALAVEFDADDTSARVTCACGAAGPRVRGRYGNAPRERLRERAHVAWNGRHRRAAA
jgi:hypothetical protein